MKIVSAEYVGQVEVYDLEIDHKDHSFYCQDIPVHNSMLCASLDGVVYEMEADKIPNYPPRHFRCRSMIVPKSDIDSTRAYNQDWFTKLSEEEKKKKLGGDYIKWKKGELTTKDIIGAMPKGQISNKTTFNDWFAKQSPKFQEGYLGKARYELYKSGKISIKDFVDVKSGKAFTIDEIKKHLQ